VSDTSRCRPRRRDRQLSQRCAPGRADRFQTCPTGFDSSHRCCGTAAFSCRRGSKQKGAGLAPSQSENGGSCGCESCRRPSSPAGVMDSMAVCENAGRGSTPGGDTFHFDNTTPMLDGRAAACKAAQSEFDSHRCLFNACLDAVVAGGALGLRVSLTYSVNGF
jgi:hypothetical protein